jgi:hypothetical protein
MSKKIKCCKAAKKTILLFLLCGFVGNANAQLLNKLKKRAEDRAKSRVEQKVNNKVDETTDKTVDKTIEVVTTPGSGKSNTDTSGKEPKTNKRQEPVAVSEKPIKETKQPVTKNTKPSFFTTTKTINFNSETPINVPNAWGPFKDAEGNRYGVHTDNDIYKVTPDGKTFLYFSNRANRWPKSSPQNPMSQEPVMDNDGNFYFVRNETNCQGIYKLTKDGMIEHIAGIGKTYDDNIKDGNGINTKICNAKSLKYFADGNLYFLETITNKTKIEDYDGEINLSDNYATPTIIRKLSPDGTVTTIKDKNKSIFVVGSTSDLVIDKDGNIVIASGYIYKLTEGGDKIKLIGTPDPYGSSQMSGGSKQRWVMADVTKAKVPGPWKLIYNSKGELIIWDYIVQRFAKFDGKTVSAFTGTSNMIKFSQNLSGGAEVLADKDGNSATAQFKTVVNLTLEEDDVYVMTYGTNDLNYLDRNLSIRKVSKDGTVKTIMGTTTNKFFGK